MATKALGRPKRSYRKRADKERVTVADFDSTVFVEVAQELQFSEGTRRENLMRYLRVTATAHKQEEAVTDNSETEFLNSTWRALLVCWQPDSTQGVDVKLDFVASRHFQDDTIVGILFSAGDDAYPNDTPSLLIQNTTEPYDLGSGASDIMLADAPIAPDAGADVEQHQQPPPQQPLKRGRKGRKRKQERMADCMETSPLPLVCEDRGVPVSLQQQGTATTDAQYELLTVSISYLDHPVCALRVHPTEPLLPLDDTFSYLRVHDRDATCAILVVLRTADRMPMAVEFYAMHKDLWQVMDKVYLRVFTELSREQRQRKS